MTWRITRCFLATDKSWVDNSHSPKLAYRSILTGRAIVLLHVLLLLIIMIYSEHNTGRPTIWITVGQGPTALAVGAGGGCLDIFTLLYPFFPLSPSLWETARYRLKYCLKGPLNPKQPTNQPSIIYRDKLKCSYQ